MKAVIKSAKFVKEFTSKYGTMYSHLIEYNDKKAYYTSKSKDQKKFVPGEEADFMEIEKTGKKGPFMTIKPETVNYAQNHSAAGKSITREQSRYSGFSTSYAKDLAVAGLIPKEEIIEWSHKFFNHMVGLDKTLLGND